MSGLESKGDHSQRTLSNLLGRKEVGHLFPEKQWRFMGNNIKISADGRAGKEASREGEAQTTSSEPGLYLM